MTARRRGSLTEADRAAWAAYAGAIRKLHAGHLSRDAGEVGEHSETAVGRAPEKTPAPSAARSHHSRTSAEARRLPPLSVGTAPGGLDRATWERFRTGRLAATRKLDLHGMTAQRAFHALTAFLRAAQADRLRCVEVVTGRGSGEGTGVIRRELPLWLNLPELRPLVLGAAYPHAANPGAVRLLLRRVR